MEITGLVIFDIDTYEPVLIASIHTNPKQPHGQRLHHLRTEIVRLGKPYVPTDVAIERGFSRYNNTTQVIFRAHGVAQELLYMYPQTVYPPKKVKLIVAGKGDATKRKVMEVINQKYPNITFEDDNQSDAFAVGICRLKEAHGMTWNIPTVQKKTREKKTTKKEG
jgi:Holliday junction resolvasome RuvABC endonuclease subunit